MSHADDEDFPFIRGSSKEGTPSDRDDVSVEGSGAGAPPLTTAASSKTSNNRPRPPAPPITGDPIAKVSSGEIDDFQARYDDDFFGSDKKKPSKGQDGKRKPGQETVPNVERPVSTQPPVTRTGDKKPGLSSTSSAKDIKPQSLLWSVFAPIVVTWIGGMVV